MGLLQMSSNAMKSSLRGLKEASSGSAKAATNTRRRGESGFSWEDLTNLVPRCMEGKAQEASMLGACSSHRGRQRKGNAGDQQQLHLQLQLQDQESACMGPGRHIETPSCPPTWPGTPRVWLRTRGLDGNLILPAQRQLARAAISILYTRIMFAREGGTVQANTRRHICRDRGPKSTVKCTQQVPRHLEGGRG